MNFNKKNYFENEVYLSLNLIEKQPENPVNYDRIINAYRKLGKLDKADEYIKIKNTIFNK